MPDDTFGGRNDTRLTLFIEGMENVANIVYKYEDEECNISKLSSFSLPEITILSNGMLISGNPISHKFYYQKQRLLLKQATEKAISVHPLETREMAEALVQLVDVSVADFDQLAKICLRNRMSRK